MTFLKENLYFTVVVDGLKAFILGNCYFIAKKMWTTSEIHSSISFWENNTKDTQFTQKFKFYTVFFV